MRAARNTALGALVVFAALATACRGKVLASVGGEVITEADVIAAEGYLPKGEKLRETVDGLVERKIILSLAKNKALGASSDEVNRAAALAAKAYRPTGSVDAASFRRYLAEEIIIAKYVDLYVFPRIKADEKTLLGYFLDRPALFIKRPPQDRGALKKMFPRHRNEVLYRYVRAEVGRLLRESGNAARADLNVEIYL
ncbi:MAG TPA: hypothetical protein VMX79_12570 [bacterium]|nr:hypothetical protein [bacterium]